VYFLDETAPYRELVEDVFRLAAAGRLELVLPGIVQMELLVGPLRRGRPDLVDLVVDMTERFPNLRVAEMSRKVLVVAAAIRAAAGLKARDTLVVATAAVERCDATLGNGRDCPRAASALPEVTVPGATGALAVPPYLRLSDYIAQT
jgi:predicted nucleic acid-binding protein